MSAVLKTCSDGVRLGGKHICTFEGRSSDAIERWVQDIKTTADVTLLDWGYYVNQARLFHHGDDEGVRRVLEAIETVKTSDVTVLDCCRKP